MKIEYITTKLKYEELITDNYDITWLKKYIDVLSDYLTNLFNLFNNNDLDDISDITFTLIHQKSKNTNLSKLIFNGLKDTNRFEEIFYSDNFKYNFNNCLEIFNLFIDHIVDIDINGVSDNNKPIFDNDIMAFPIFEVTVNDVYSILSKLFELCLIDTHYKKIIETLIVRILNLYVEKLKNKSYEIYENLAFFVNFGTYFNKKIINLRNTYSVVENGLSSKFIESLFITYKDLLVNVNNFKNTLSQNFIFTEEFIENNLECFNLKVIHNNIARVQLIKNSRIDDDDPNNKIDTLVSYPISLDFYDKFKDKLIPFNDFVFSYIQPHDISLLAFLLKYKRNNLKIRYFLDGKFICDILKKYEIQDFCTMFFKSLNYSDGDNNNAHYNNRSERRTYWEKLLNNIFFTNISLSLLQNNLIKSHINYGSIFNNKLIYENAVENIISKNICTNLFSHNDLEILSHNFVYSDKLLAEIIPYLNLEILVKSKFLNKKQLKVIKKYLNKIKNLIIQKV